LVVLTMLYFVAPFITVVLSSFTETRFIKFPPQGLTLKWYGVFLFGGQYWTGIIRSLITGASAVVLSTLIGVPAAYALIRYRFPGRDWINIATLIPVVVPEMIIAIALLQFFAGLDILPSLFTLVVGHTLLTVPFMIRAVSASLRGLDPSVEEVARGLGAYPLRAFMTVTLPLIRPGIFAGAIFVFVISLDLFLVSMFLSEVFTLPVDIYWKLRHNSEPSVMALATLIMALTVPAIIGLAKLVGLESFIGVGKA
jgi:putative spermidine/putrescine transport system permease protein